MATKSSTLLEHCPAFALGADQGRRACCQTQVRACLRVGSMVDNGVRVSPVGVSVDDEQAHLRTGAGGDDDESGR